MRACIQAIKTKNTHSFETVLGLDPKKTILEKNEEDGNTLVHIIAQNANLHSAEQLECLLKISKQNGIATKTILDHQNRDGLTALSVCVTSTASIGARLTLTKLLIEKGANPFLGNTVPLLKQLKSEDISLINGNKELKNLCSEILQKITAQRRLGQSCVGMTTRSGSSPDEKDSPLASSRATSLSS